MGVCPQWEMLAARWKSKVRWLDMMRQCERLLGECCLGKTGWWIGELMGENRAYPLWLYPRIHVHARDQSRSCRTSSDWMISKPHGHPLVISQFRRYRIIRPLSVSTHLHSAIHNPWSYLYWVFGYVSHSLSSPLFYPITHSPFYPCFIFPLRLCAPLIHSSSDSSPDVSLFIPPMAPLAFVFCWFICSHDPLLFRFAHKSFSRSLSPLFPYHFLYGQIFPNMGK